MPINGTDDIRYNPATGCFETMFTFEMDGIETRVASWLKAPITADPKTVLASLHDIAMRRLERDRAMVSRKPVALQSLPQAA